MCRLRPVSGSPSSFHQPPDLRMGMHRVRLFVPTGMVFSLPPATARSLRTSRGGSLEIDVKDRFAKTLRPNATRCESGREGDGIGPLHRRRIKPMKIALLTLGIPAAASIALAPVSVLNAPVAPECERG